MQKFNSVMDIAVMYFSYFFEVLNHFGKNIKSPKISVNCNIKIAYFR